MYKDHCRFSTNRPVCRWGCSSSASSFLGTVLPVRGSWSWPETWHWVWKPWQKAFNHEPLLICQTSFVRPKTCLQAQKCSLCQKMCCLLWKYDSLIGMEVASLWEYICSCKYAHLWREDVYVCLSLGSTHFQMGTHTNSAAHRKTKWFVGSHLHLWSGAYCERADHVEELPARNKLVWRKYHRML